MLGRKWLPLVLCGATLLGIALVLKDSLLGREGETSDASFVIVNGEPVPGPWEISVEDGKYHINGRPFQSPKPPPDVSSFTPETLKRMKDVEAFYDAMRTELRPLFDDLTENIDTATSILADRLRGEPLVENFREQPGYGFLVTWKGLSYEMGISPWTLAIPSAPPREEQLAHMRESGDNLMQSLQTPGTLLIITDGGMTTLRPPESRRVVRQIRSILSQGGDPDEEIDHLAMLVGRETARQIAQHRSSFIASPR